MIQKLTYQTIIDTAREILNNDLIYKKDLELVYYLDENLHNKLDEDLFYRINKDNNDNFIHQEVIEVNIETIKFKFLIKN